MLNNYSGIGKLDTEPREFNTNTGKKYYKFTLVIPAGKNQEGKEITDRINCAAYGKAAEIAGYMHSGDVIAITGPIKTANYKDQNGNWVNTWNVNVYTIDFIRRAQQNRQPTQQAVQNTPPPLPPPPPEAPPQPQEEFNDSHLPFDF